MVEEYLLYSDSVYADDYEWFSLINGDGLYRRNLIDNEIEFVFYFDGGRNNFYFRHSDILYYKGNIVCVPFQNKIITIYNIANKEKVDINIPDSDVCNCTYFMKAVPYREYIYFIPGRYKWILRMNVNNYELEKVFEFKNNDWITWDKSQPNIYEGAYVYRDKLFLAPHMSPFLITIDLKNSNVEHIAIDSYDKGFIHIIEELDNIYIIANNGDIYLFVEGEKVKRIYINEEQDFFKNAIKFNKSIFFAGGRSGKVYKYDIEKNVMINKNVIDKTIKKKFDLAWHDFLYIKVNDSKKIEVLSTWDCKRYILNPDNLEIDSIESAYELTDLQRKNLVNNNIRQVLFEEGILGINLEDFIFAL